MTDTTNYLYKIKGETQEFWSLCDALEHLFFLIKGTKIYTIEALTDLIKDNIIMYEKRTYTTEISWTPYKFESNEKPIERKGWFKGCLKHEK